MIQGAALVDNVFAPFSLKASISSHDRESLSGASSKLLGGVLTPRVCVAVNVLDFKYAFEFCKFGIRTVFLLD